MTREITNDDLWSAIRGLGMYSMSRADLAELYAHHAAGPHGMFASKVIAEAARQVLATKSSD